MGRARATVASGGAGLSVLAASVLGACGSPAPVVDHRQIERQLADTVREQKSDVTVVVRCPSGLKAVRGATFECHLMIGADAVRYTVTISGVHGGQYEAETRPTQPVLDASVIVDTVRSDAGGDPTKLAVTCGPHRFVQLAVHASLACTLTLGGQTSAVAATVTDEGGDVAFAAAPSGTAAGATTSPAPSSQSPAPQPPGPQPPGPQPPATPAPSLPGD